MKNEYEIRGDITVIFINSPKYGRKEVLIDTNDLEKVKQLPRAWSLLWSKGNRNFYVQSTIYKPNGKRTTVTLHRFILGITDSKKHVDHINHNTLDNTRDNLNIVTHSENQQNKRKYNTNISGCTGVSWHKECKKWQVIMSINGKRKHIGLYVDIKEAVKAREKAEEEHYKYKQKIQVVS